MEACCAGRSTVRGWRWLYADDNGHVWRPERIKSPEPVCKRQLLCWLCGGEGFGWDVSCCSELTPRAQSQLATPRFVDQVTSISTFGYTGWLVQSGNKVYAVDCDLNLAVFIFIEYRKINSSSGDCELNRGLLGEISQNWLEKRRSRFTLGKAFGTRIFW